MRPAPWRRGQALGLAWLALACGAPEPAPDPGSTFAVEGTEIQDRIVLVVDGRRVPMGEVEGRAMKPGRRRQVLQQHARRILLADEARRRGLEEDPEVARRLRALRYELRREEDKVLLKALGRTVREASEPDEALLRSLYEVKKPRTPPLWKVRLWQAEGEETARVQAASREPAPPDAREADWRARELSADTPRPFRQGETGVRWAHQRNGAWWVAELVERVPEARLTLEELRPRLRRQGVRLLAQRRMDELAARLFGEREVELVEGAVVDDELWAPR